nr:hypothetical protein [Tanacetum cinerariifolium]
MLLVAPPLLDYIPGPEEPQTQPAPQDEDEHEPIFIEPHDLDFDGPVDYPIDGGDNGDDDDDDSSGDDANDDDEDKEDEEEEHLAPADFAVIIPTDELVAPPEGTEPDAISLPPEAEVERLLAMPTPSPSPLSLLSPPSAGERLARCTAPAALPSPPLPPPLHMPPPIDCRDDVAETEMLPCNRLCLSTLGSRYEVGESLAARPTGGQGIDYGFVSTLDAEARRRGIGEMQQTEITELRETDRRRHEQMADTLRVIRDMRREMGDIHVEMLALRGQPMRAGQPGGDARVPNHQDAPTDADSHI